MHNGLQGTMMVLDYSSPIEKTVFLQLNPQLNPSILDPPLTPLTPLLHEISKKEKKGGNE